MTYFPRLIDTYLTNWSKSQNRKPILIRGARQVGKSSAVRHLGEKFPSFLEINFERNPEYKAIFKENLDINRIINELEIISGIKINENDTLLFFDEIQESPQALMSLRYFKEEKPQLHVAAAGSLLEIALDELPTYGVGRIHSIYMYPMTFDEFLIALSEKTLLEYRNSHIFSGSFSETIHKKFIKLFKDYIIIGGMPEVVASWIETHDYLKCQELQDDLISGYEADFAKYKGKTDTSLMFDTLKSAALQLSNKFTFSRIRKDTKTEKLQKSLELLIKAGLLIPVYRSAANGYPLGSEKDDRYFKILTLDSGLTLRLLNMSANNYDQLITGILTGSSVDLINKGPMAELVAGLELLRYKNLNIRQEIFYWAREEKNSMAEIDYLDLYEDTVLPVEVKAGTQGGMKSLWYFMEKKKLSTGIRLSLENVGEIKRQSTIEEGKVMKVLIFPLYAISCLRMIPSNLIL